MANSATVGSDIFFVQNSDLNSATNSITLGAGAGNDTYVFSSAFVTKGTYTLQDNQGTNIIQLVDGLQIESSIVGSNVVQLTLTNGVVINVTGADAATWQYAAGGAAGAPPAGVGFASFVTDVLKTTVPTTGTSSGGAITIGGGGGGAGTVTLPVGSSAEVVAAAAAEVFSLNVTGAAAVTANTQPTITGFSTALDALRLDLPVASAGTTLAALNGLSLGGGNVVEVSSSALLGTLATFGFDVDGQFISLSLTGIADASTVAVTVI